MCHEMYHKDTQEGCCFGEGTQEGRLVHLDSG